VGSSGIKRRKRRQRLPKLPDSLASEPLSTPSLWTPMGIVAGWGKFFRAATSPDPKQRRPVHVMTACSVLFLVAVVVLAFALGR
jgi:hypothetical protein